MLGELAERLNGRLAEEGEPRQVGKATKDPSGHLTLGTGEYPCSDGSSERIW